MEEVVNDVKALKVTQTSSQASQPSSPTSRSEVEVPQSLPVPTIVMTPPPEDPGPSSPSDAAHSRSVVPVTSPYHDLSVSQLAEDIEVLQNDLLYPAIPDDTPTNKWIEDELDENWAIFHRQIYEVFLDNLACPHCQERPRTDESHRTSAAMEEICVEVMNMVPNDKFQSPSEYLGGILEYLQFVERGHQNKLAEEGCEFAGVKGNGSA